jgi:hypothetical protein
VKPFRREVNRFARGANAFRTSVVDVAVDVDA